MCYKDKCKNCEKEIIFKRLCDYKRFLNNKIFLCIKCYKKEFYYKNHKNTLEIKKKWRDNNKEKQSEYYYNNKNKIREYFSEWYKNNYDKIVEYRNIPEVKAAKKNCDHKRRTICKETNITSLYLEQLFNDSIICPYCLIKLNKINFKNKNYISVDHMIPISRGGKHTMDNIQIICKNCNSKKKNKTHEEYISFLSGNFRGR